MEKMTRSVAVAVAVLLCIFLQLAECGSSDAYASSYTVDTTEKYAKLRSGEYNGLYKVIYVTSGAHPDILLEPQYFPTSAFNEIQFISIGGQVNNTITLSYRFGLVILAQFNEGESPLRGIPKGFAALQIEYSDAAIPTSENIDAILSSGVKSLTIKNKESVAVSLSQRGEELSKLNRLNDLHLSVNPYTYSKVNVNAFIADIKPLKIVDFQSKDLTTGQIKEFEVSAQAPSNWKFLIRFDNTLVFNKK